MEQRAVVRDELAAFDQATGFDRVRLTRVSIRDLSGSDYGRWDPRRHRISLEQGLTEEDTIGVLRHELCHALDSREGPFHRADEALFDRLVDGYLQDDEVEDGSQCATRTCWEREVFAMFCGRGPWVAQATAAPCPGDDPDGSAVMALLADQIWTGEPVLERYVEPGDIVASVTVGLLGRPVLDAPVPTTAHAHPTFEPGVIRLVWEDELEDDGSYDDGFFDVWTGEERIGPVYGMFEWGLPPRDRPDGVPPDYVVTQATVGWQEGPAAVRVELDQLHLPPATRWVWSDGERWSVLGDGCAPAEPEPFAAEERIFTLEIDGDTIAWREVQGP